MWNGVAYRRDVRSGWWQQEPVRCWCALCKDVPLDCDFVDPWGFSLEKPATPFVLRPYETSRERFNATVYTTDYIHGVMMQAETEAGHEIDIPLLQIVTVEAVRLLVSLWRRRVLCRKNRDHNDLLKWLHIGDRYRLGCSAIWCWATVSDARSDSVPIHTWVQGVRVSWQKFRDPLTSRYWVWHPDTHRWYWAPL